MKIWEPKSCCCGASVRTGTLIIGWLALVGSTLNLLSALRYIPVTQNDWENMCTDIIKESEESGSDFPFEIEQFCSSMAKFLIGSLAVSGVASALTLVSSVLLLVGVNKNKAHYMLPYLMYQALVSGLSILIGVLLVGYTLYVGSIVLAITVIIVFGLGIFLEAYLLLVIRACYLELKNHSSDVDIPYSQQKDVPYVHQHDMSYKV